MDMFTIIGILVLTGIALVLVLYPLWQQTHFQASFQANSGQTLEEYEARYQAQLAAIKDLMFDYEMGKMSSEDYETLVARAKLEAAKIRQQMDDHLTAAPESSGINAALDAEIEALITRLRHNGPVPADDNALLQEVDAEIELLKNAQPKTVTSIICPACNNTLRPDDAFCSRCGQPAPSPEAAIDTCPQCGYTTQPDDAFCTKCGTALVKSKSYEDVKL